ncbi:pancreatic triacylglycerol lipase isoform X2 [Anoplophora glabripennis]|uniref:pancreatic triacylglycerol lipase isoform X2 n=2 Tax=Anoplophora glabripennis TaxID=217634 RepID=UPI000C75CAB9|nr:pancreatic triacylglycerol lipase isoform X2 [Anoplophora glabripennis]
MVGVNNGSSLFVQTLMYMMNQSIIQQETSYNYYYMQIGQESNASKCYGIYGCFHLGPPWTSESRPVSLFPDDLQKIEPRYPLYTRDHQVVPIFIDLNEFDYINSAGIAAHKPIYLVSHGYTEGGGISWIYNIVRALLRIEDCNVIIVDWQGGASPPYTQAVANIRLVGAMTAHLLNDIARYTGPLKLDHVHAIGHSLGAHMCGYIGYTLQKEFNMTLGRITGLDPAEPHFSKAKPPVRLDRSAAQYVDIIHTDASQFIRGGLGMTESIGHVDYYPNGGTDQPGCGKSVLQYIKDANGSLFNGVKKYLGCNHVRSHEYFLESIVPNPKCKFLTISCPSYQDFVSGKCFDCGKYREKCIPFGYHGRKHYEKLLGLRWRHTSRVQFLLTASDKPYCRGHYRLIVQISNNTDSVDHGGEIGQLLFTMHSTSDGRGQKSRPAGFISGYHKPGALHVGVVATDEVPHLKAVEVEWKYNSSLFNPLTWRILTTPKIFINKVTVEALEINES